MQIIFTYNDLRKIGTVFRQPGIVIVDCRPGGSSLELDVRIDVSQFINAVKRICATLPVIVKAEFDLQLLDEHRFAIKLAALRLDKSEIPLLAKPFFNAKIARRQLFKAIKPTPGITVKHDEERVILDLPELIPEPFSKAKLQRLDCDSSSVNLQMKLDND